MALALTAGASVFLATLHARQKLGPPGLRVVDEPIYCLDGGASTNAPVMVSSHRVFLPPRVLDYFSQQGVIASVMTNLPRDSVFGRRMYGRTNGPLIDCQVVLMGADRSSIHKPQYCLNGSGLRIVGTEPVSVRVARPHAYDLPVMKLNLRRESRDENGTPHTQAGVFVYWFVADGELTASHADRMWWMARDMLRKGVLQRWAYVICIAPCAPGMEEATFEQMKEFIAAAVPEFVLATGPPVTPTGRAAK